MTDKSLFLCVGAIAGIAIGYILSQRSKLKNVCDKLDTAIDSVSEDVEINVPEGIVEKAIKKAVDRDVKIIVSAETKRIANEALTSVKQGMKDEIQKKIETSITDADIASIKAKVLDSVASKAGNRIADGFESIFREAKRTLSRQMGI